MLETMKPKRIQSGRTTLSMLRIQSDSWYSIARGLFPFLVILLICVARMRFFGEEARQAGYTVYFGESVFWALNIGINLVAVPLMLLIMISEMPRRFSFQCMSLIRSSRKSWLASQMLYCLVVSIALFAIMTLCVMLTSLPYVSPGGGWSDTARIAAGEISEWGGITHPYIRENFTPLTASLLAIPPVIFYFLTLLNIVLFCNLLGLPLLGVVVYLIIIWAEAIFNFAYLPWYFNPRDYTSLSRMPIDALGMGYYWKVLAGYVIVNALLYGAMLLRIKRADLDFLVKPTD